VGRPISRLDRGIKGVFRVQGRKVHSLAVDRAGRKEAESAVKIVSGDTGQIPDFVGICLREKTDLGVPNDPAITVCGQLRSLDFTISPVGDVYPIPSVSPVPRVEEKLFELTAGVFAGNTPRSGIRSLRIGIAERRCGSECDEPIRRWRDQADRRIVRRHGISYGISISVAYRGDCHPSRVALRTSYVLRLTFTSAAVSNEIIRRALPPLPRSENRSQLACSGRYTEREREREKRKKRRKKERNRLEITSRYVIPLARSPLGGCANFSTLPVTN